MVDFSKHTLEGKIKQLSVAIPSLGRSGAMRVASRLPAIVKQQAVIICHSHEKDAYAAAGAYHGINVVALPNNSAHRGIHNVRRWVFKNSKRNKIVMLDDDIQFYTRRPGEARLVNATEEETIKLFAAVSAKLETHAHVAVSAREGNNRGPDDWVEDTRMLRFLAYDRDVVKRWVKLGRVEVMEDFDISLQLLRAGYHNAVSYHWAQGQPGTQAAGGCSEYRTHDVQHAAATQLAALHPGLVRTRTKENKTGGEFGTRTEVTIYWKKAMQQYEDLKL